MWQVPGDGRELVVAVPDAVTVRAEDGRRVEATDISPFISNLPFGAPVTCVPRSSHLLASLPDTHIPWGYILIHPSCLSAHWTAVDPEG